MRVIDYDSNWLTLKTTLVDRLICDGEFTISFEAERVQPLNRIDPNPEVLYKTTVTAIEDKEVEQVDHTIKKLHKARRPNSHTRECWRIY